MVTVITKTIGSGKDYATFTLAEAAVPTIVGGTDLVAADTAVVFEADAGTYNESVVFNGTLATDATRNVTYRPAAGAEHGGVFDAGVNIEGITTVNDNYTAISGIQLTIPTLVLVYWYGVGIKLEGVLVRAFSGTYGLGSISGNSLTIPTIVNNCVFELNGSAIRAVTNIASAGRDSYVIYSNCTVTGQPTSTSQGAFVSIANAGLTAKSEFYNCIVLTGQSVWMTFSTGTNTAIGSNNFGGATNPFPAAIQGSPYPITASQSADPGAGDYALYVGKNGALLDSPNNDVIDQGVGPDVNSSVPRTDILGNTRYGANANPGAFEIPQATTVITKTIGPVGRDYASFTLAEADVTNIPTSTDLVNENEAIVFEADAATYSESVTFQSTLTTDATRQVTYKPASGSEHGGVFGAGVAVTPSSVQGPCIVTDNYTSLIGLEIHNNNFSIFPEWTGEGIECRDLLCGLGTSSDSWGFAFVNNNTSIEHTVFENCVFRFGSSVCALWNRVSSGSTPTAMKAINCSFIGAQPSLALKTYATTVLTQGTSYMDIVNCVALNGGPVFQEPFGGTLTLTGSNNFGGSTNPFPVAIQGSPYPITPTTDTNPGPGDWAIYDAATGALIDDSDNDVLGGGVGPDVNLDVPTTDIQGIPRTGSTTDPGAFVLPPVEQDTWTPVMVRRNDPVDVYGVLTFGDAYINAVEDTLSVTGADGTDATPAIPVGTRALWIQLVSQTGAAAGETCDVSIEVSASQSLTLATLNGAGTAVGNVPGLMQFPVDCLGQNDPDTPVYPRVKMVTGSTVGASDVVTIRVVAICGKQTNTTWS